MRKVSFLSYNMTQADGANQDGLIPIGRQFDFIGDVETEEISCATATSPCAWVIPTLSATRMSMWAT